MTDPFMTEIRIFPYNFPPRGWAWCTGQLLSISQNTALFSLMGTTYGGDGRTTFALPNLQGRAAMGTGQGRGLSPRDLGETGGDETVTLTSDQNAKHNHVLKAASDPANLQVPGPTRVIARSQNANAYKASGSFGGNMAVQEIGPAGDDLPHNNMQPYLTLNFNIALQGVYPARP